MQIRNVEKIGISQKRKEIIKRLSKEEFTASEIAKIINLDRTWVWRIIKSKK